MHAFRSPLPSPQVVFAPVLLPWRTGFAARGGLWDAVRSGDLLSSPPDPPSSWGPITRAAPRESEVQVAPRAWQRPGAIVYGRANRSGAPLGQISLPKSPRHGQLEGRPGGWLGLAAVAGSGELLCTGAWACPSGDHPVASVTGSRRRRASKATGIDRTPNSGVGAALGLRDDPLNFGAALRRGPVGHAAWCGPSVGPGRAWPCSLAAARDRKSLGKEVGCPGQGLQTPGPASQDPAGPENRAGSPSFPEKL